MNIKSAVTTEGTPIKIIPYSPEMLACMYGKEAFQDILINRIQTHFDSHDYVKAHEEFTALCSEVEDRVPETKSIMNKIDSAVVAKETECFDAGYRAGMADLMTALTFNSLQIINTQIVDMKAIDEKRKAKAEVSGDE